MRKPLFALALAAILSLAAGCEFLGWGVYPTYQQNVDSRLKFADLVYAQTGYELDHVMGSAVLRADPSLPYHLLVLCSLKNYGGNAVFFLDPLSLAFEAWVSNGNAGLPLAVVYDTWGIPTGAGFSAAYLRMDPLSLTDSTTPWAQTSGTAGVILKPIGAENLVMWSSNGGLGLHVFENSWSETYPGSPFVKPASMGNYNLVLASVANASSSTAVRLLLRDEQQWTGLFLEFASPEDLITAMDTAPQDLKTSALASKSISFGHDMKELWLTDKEILAYEDYDKGKLVRYSLADGSELDSRSFSTEDVQGLSFSSATSRWYYWDKVRKEFLSLRTWW